MNGREKRLLEQLKNYNLILEDAKKLEADLNESGNTGNMTARYGFTSGHASGTVSSKVENLSLKNMETKRKLEAKRRVLNAIDSAIRNAGLNKRELDLVECTIKGYSLSAYARQRNIYKSHVYKIRDKALGKMANYIQNRS